MATHASTRPWPARPAGFFAGAGPATHALLRIGAALLFMQHGAQKLLGWFGGMDGSGATASLGSLMGLAGILELGGGALLLLGLLTRPVALVLVAQMIAAYVIAHLPQGGLPVQNQGELALLYALVFAFLFGNGAGPLSLGAFLGRRRGDAARPAPAAEEAPEIPRRRRDTAA